MKDYYDILGVARDASPDDIKRAFRTLARESHPDANPDDPTAEERFRRVAEAYEVLSDPEKRARFDRGEVMGAADLFSSFGGLDEILSQFFGGQGFGGQGFGGSGGIGRRAERGSDVGVLVDLTLVESLHGVSRDVAYVAPTTCDVCEGSGAAEGSSLVTCATCAGRGQVQVQRATLLGAMLTTARCTTCNGRGSTVERPCDECRGHGRTDRERTVTVDVPAGVDDGTRLRLTRRGGAGDIGHPPGDLYVEVRIAPDDRFERNGADLHHETSLSYSQAVLGATITVPLVDGETELDIPGGTASGTVFRMQRHGMPRLRRRGLGDLFVTVTVDVPTEVSDDERGLLEALAELRGESVQRPKRRKRRRS